MLIFCILYKYILKSILELIDFLNFNMFLLLLFFNRILNRIQTVRRDQCGFHIREINENEIPEFRRTI